MFLTECFLYLFTFVAAILGIPLNSPLPNLSSYSEWLLTLNDPLANHPRAFEYGDKAYTVSTFKARFFEAYHYCQYYNMGLVSVNSKEESQAIHSNLKKLGYKYERFWTSGSRLPDGVHWIWMSTGKPVEYTFWGQYEPSGGDETCIEFRKHHDLIIWNDVDCFHDDLHLYFICERQKSTEATPKCGKSKNTERLTPPGSIPIFHFQKPWDNSSTNPDYSEELDYDTTTQNNRLKSESLTLDSHTNGNKRKCGHAKREEPRPSFRSLNSPRMNSKEEKVGSGKQATIIITTENDQTKKKCVKSFNMGNRKSLDIFINVNANKRKC